MKAAYRNSIRSKQMIRESLIQLLDKKHISDITVTDIVKNADINRGTFYNHYNNPIDVVVEMEKELIAALMEKLKEVSSIKEVDNIIDLVVEHFKLNEKDFKIIIKSIPTSFIDEMKKALISNIKDINRSVSEIDLSLIINAISGLFIDYLKGSIHFSYSEISEKLKDFVKVIVKKI